MTNEISDNEKKWLEENKENFGGLFDIDITDRVLRKVMAKVGVEQSHIDKAKEVVDMLEFTKEDGKDVVYLNIGENVQLRIIR